MKGGHIQSGHLRTGGRLPAEILFFAHPGFFKPDVFW